jgi:AbrB family looped-hinge helix DNA binding protein
MGGHGVAGLSLGLAFATVRRYLTVMHTRISSKGQIVLPASVRQQDDIKPGQVFAVERIDRGEYRLRRCEPAPNQGLADWLLSCPEKGFFVEVASESTNDL